MNPKIDEYFDKLNKWQKELKLLRGIMLDCGLMEEFKWKHPCYTFNKKNVILLQEFKDYCAIGFMKGALLKDEKGILNQITENVQAGRQIRFKNVKSIETLESTIKAYVYEAIEAEKAGLEVKMKETSEFDMPEELTEKFREDSAFKEAFEKLTPGRQRGYLLHFAQPKQSKTREARINKNWNKILRGKGLNDCECGLSKRMPNCDGSHKYLNK